MTVKDMLQQAEVQHPGNSERPWYSKASLRARTLSLQSKFRATRQAVHTFATSRLGTQAAAGIVLLLLGLLGVCVFLLFALGSKSARQESTRGQGAEPLRAAPWPSRESPMPAG